MRTRKTAITTDRDKSGTKNLVRNRRKEPSAAHHKLRRSRLARECARLELTAERTLAEEGLSRDFDEWPKY